MRRFLILLLALGIVALGAVLYLNIRESRLFRITAPVQPTNVQQVVSGSTVTSLTTVSTSTLLENPRYTGQDPENRRWEVTAINAQQQGSAESTTLILQQVNANLEVPAKSGDSPTNITLTADKGTYLQSQSMLHLNGNVVVEGQGLTLHAPTITTNLADRHLVASGGIHATLTMPAGPKK